MKRSDLLKMILGVVLGAIGLMLFKACEKNKLPNKPKLAKNIDLEINQGESIKLIVEVDDGCTAQWYNQPEGGSVIIKNTNLDVDNLAETTTFYVEAVLKEDPDKVSKERLAVKVEVFKDDEVADEEDERKKDDETASDNNKEIEKDKDKDKENVKDREVSAEQSPEKTKKTENH